MDWLRALWQRLSEYEQPVGIGEIARRYFAMNAFDGVITIIGVLMGNLAAGVEDPRIVVTTGLATCIAMGVSGLWGAYLTEDAERQRDLESLSRQVLRDLRNSRIGRASRNAAVTVALVDGLSPFLAALIALIPFIFAGLLPSIQWAYYTALAIALTVLFGLGLFLGYIAHRGSMLIFGIKTLIAGVVALLIALLLGS